MLIIELIQEIDYIYNSKTISFEVFHGFRDKCPIETNVIRVFLRMGLYQQSFHFGRRYILNSTEDKVVYTISLKYSCIIEERYHLDLGNTQCLTLPGASVIFVYIPH